MQVAPDSLITAARGLTAIGDDIKFAHLQAETPTTSIASAGVDEVSAAVADAFAAHAREFQNVAGQATAFHDQFVQSLTGGANAYQNAEAASAAAMSALPAAAMSALPAETFPSTPVETLIWLGAVGLSPFVLTGLLGFLSTLLAAYWAATLLFGG
ncbi:PE family protein [Mycobacterium sp.]|uniref:PE family protein n=1 Tax=Mycobacterium sp. TaxID=1785 RepID=UPI003A85625A